MFVQTLLLQYVDFMAQRTRHVWPNPFIANQYSHGVVCSPMSMSATFQDQQVSVRPVRIRKGSQDHVSVLVLLLYFSSRGIQAKTGYSFKLAIIYPGVI